MGDEHSAPANLVAGSTDCNLHGLEPRVLIKTLAKVAMQVCCLCSFRFNRWLHLIYIAPARCRFSHHSSQESHRLDTISPRIYASSSVRMLNHLCTAYSTDACPDDPINDRVAYKCVG
jgi:hypothetical protein